MFSLPNLGIRLEQFNTEIYGEPTLDEYTISPREHTFTCFIYIISGGLIYNTVNESPNALNVHISANRLIIDDLTVLPAREFNLLRITVKDWSIERDGDKYKYVNQDKVVITNKSIDDLWTRYIDDTNRKLEHFGLAPLSDIGDPLIINDCIDNGICDNRYMVPVGTTVFTKIATPRYIHTSSLAISSGAKLVGTYRDNHPDMYWLDYIYHEVVLNEPGQWIYSTFKDIGDGKFCLVVAM